MCITHLLYLGTVLITKLLCTIQRSDKKISQVHVHVITVIISSLNLELFSCVEYLLHGTVHVNPLPTTRNS